MRQLILALALTSAFSLTAAVPDAAAQSYGPGLWPGTWYGPYAGPYAGFGATGFGATGYGCGQGAYAFANYGFGTVQGLGPGMPTCGGFGNYPYLYPFYTGYPFANGAGAMGSLALSGLLNPNPFFGTTGCDGLLLGSAFAGQASPAAFPGAAGQYTIGNNLNLLNLANPALATLSNFGTLGTQNLFGCVNLR